jgi:hypothetical protein
MQVMHLRQLRMLSDCLCYKALHVHVLSHLLLLLLAFEFSFKML